MEFKVEKIEIRNIGDFPRMSINTLVCKDNSEENIVVSGYIYTRIKQEIGYLRLKKEHFVSEIVIRNRFEAVFYVSQQDQELIPLSFEMKFDPGDRLEEGSGIEGSVQIYILKTDREDWDYIGSMLIRLPGISEEVKQKLMSKCMKEMEYYDETFFKPILKEMNIKNVRDGEKRDFF